MSDCPSSHITAQGSIDSPSHHPTTTRKHNRLKPYARTDKQNGESMDVFEAITNRRSIRAFKTTEIPDETIDKLIEAAQSAPSAGNIQPWEFIVIRKQETKHKLAEAALNQAFIEEAPVVVVACANEDRSAQRYGQRGKTLYCLQDTAAAIQNINLAAHALGLGTCWIGAFNEDKARQILNTPAGIRPIAIVPIGNPNEFPQPRKKRLMEEIVHRETY
jgi:nitroreductase